MRNALVWKSRFGVYTSLVLRLSRLLFSFYHFVPRMILWYRILVYERMHSILLVQVRLQVICLLIGGLAIVSVRKQNRLSASMFDRRKQQRTPAASTSTANNNNRGKRNSCIVTNNDDEEHEIEFSTMTNQTTREMAPLVARMEII